MSALATPSTEPDVRADPPFAGLRVLDFCWVGAGALVTKLLAEHGADVIKVESRARPDNLRLAPPYRPGSEGIEGSGYFASRNSNKRSFALDMRHADAAGIALDLARECSVVTSNFRPGVMDRWGLSYDAICAVNPSVIYLAMPMQGSDGPHARYTGFGSTIAALAGLVHLSGRPDRLPVGTGTHYPDHVPNPGHALVALIAALYHREHTGQGQEIELSQFESTLNVIGQAFVQQTAGGDPPTRTGNRSPEASPRAVFRCRDEEAWVAVSCRTDAEWQALARALGHHEWLDDPRFARLDDRKANEDELEAEVASAVATRPRSEVVDVLRAEGVPVAPVNSSKDILMDPDLVATGFWQRVRHPVIGEMAVAGPSFRWGNRDRTVLQRAPLLGEHTREIATDVLGLDGAEVDRLVTEGVLA